MKDLTTQLYFACLKKTFEYVFSKKEIDLKILSYYQGFYEQAKDFYRTNNIQRLKRMFNSIVPDMTDDPNYLAYVEEFRNHFPKLLSGSERVIKRILKQGKIINKVDYDIINSIVQFVETPIFNKLKPNQISTLRQYCFDFEYQNG